MYELGTPVADEDSVFVAPDIKKRKKKAKEKIKRMDEWTYTSGKLWTKTDMIVAKRKQKVTAYSLWKQNKTENEVGGCIVIEKNTNLFAEWKCLEREEKQVYYTIPINSHVNNLFDLISFQQGAICNFNNENLAKTFEAIIADFWFKYGFLL